MSKEIIHKALSYKLNGIFYSVHNQLGRYCTHKQYSDAVEIVFRKEGISYVREVEIPIKFLGEQVRGNRIDFLVEDLIPIDVKVERYITKADFMQMIRYLRATNKKLGIIVNFRQRTLNPKRIINANIRI